MAKEQVSSILRALQILECFMDRETEWTLKALVDHLDMPSTTVFRQVSTLAERQYLVQDPVRKSYRVGPRLMLLASAILGQSDLRRVARPELEHLSDTVHETINLSVLLEHDIFYLDKVETHRSIVCNTQIGAGLCHQQRQGDAFLPERGIHRRLLPVDEPQGLSADQQHHHRFRPAAFPAGPGPAQRICHG